MDRYEIGKCECCGKNDCLKNGKCPICNEKQFPDILNQMFGGFNGKENKNKQEGV